MTVFAKQTRQGCRDTKKINDTTPTSPVESPLSPVPGDDPQSCVVLPPLPPIKPSALSVRSVSPLHLPPQWLKEQQRLVAEEKRQKLKAWVARAAHGLGQRVGEDAPVYSEAVCVSAAELKHATLNINATFTRSQSVHVPTPALPTPRCSSMLRPSVQPTHQAVALTEPPQPLETQSAPPATVRRSNTSTWKGYHARITALYATYTPEKLGPRLDHRIAKALRKYEGSEEVLLQALTAHFTGLTN